ncbi:LysR substrate-binding domain-containing protein [Roseovarius sp.]|uniref:LysR substrate-binding domain-containing protein n=1 Tax=Roseovarius sp. TaxID=1486281 RepID=UPI003B5AEF1D
MRHLIPSTKALIALEAAARRRSFALAANELLVTESAISKQISNLEHFLDLKLFHRNPGGVELTDVGRAYAVEVRKTLRDLEDQTAAIVGHVPRSSELHVASLPTFATRWLMPRLKDFSSQVPGVIVNISNRLEATSIGDAEFDAVIHFRDARDWKGECFNLFSDDLVAVLNPSHFSVKAWLRDPQSVPLLGKSKSNSAWRRWFVKAGVAHPAPEQGPRYDSYSTLIEAVRSGIGVGLIPRSYVEPDLNMGLLEMPSPSALQAEKTFSLFLPDGSRKKIALKAFVNWLTGAARAYEMHHASTDPVHSGQPDRQ